MIVTNVYSQENHLYPGLQHPSFFMQRSAESAKSHGYAPICAVKEWGLNEQWYWYLDDSGQGVTLFEKKIDIKNSNLNELRYSLNTVKCPIPQVLSSGLKQYWQKIIKEVHYPEDLSKYRPAILDAPLYIFSYYNIFGEAGGFADDKLDICIIAEMVRSYIMAENDADRRNWLDKIMIKVEQPKGEAKKGHGLTLDKTARLRGC